MKKIYLFVDDERKFSQDFLKDEFVLVTTRSYQTTVDFLEHCRDKHLEVFIDLDHDLGIGKTGYDICKFIVETNFPLLGYTLHTMNPVGRQNMNQLLSHYGYAHS